MQVKSRAQFVPRKPTQHIAVPAACTNMEFGFFDFDGDSGSGGGDLLVVWGALGANQWALAIGVLVNLRGPAVHVDSWRWPSHWAGV